MPLQEQSTFTDQDLSVDLFGRRRAFLLRKPNRANEDPVLLMNLAMDRRTTLDQHPYGISSDIFLAAGHWVCSLDLPNHGDNANEYGEGLPGIAAAMAAGVNVFDQFRQVASAAIDQAVQIAGIRSNRIFATGTSRGGLCALHVMAQDARVAGIAAIVPVTDLLQLQEFAPLGRTPAVAAASAIALIPQLRGRNVFIAIGLNDQRVGTAQCLDFHARLLLASGGMGLVVLHIDPTAVHRSTDAAYHRGAAFLLDLAAKTAQPEPKE